MTRWPARPGLRATITFSFAFGGLLLATLMALGTYTVARGYLIQQRERAAQRQAFADASFVRDGLLTSGAVVTDILGSVSPPTSGAVVIRWQGRWYSSSLQVDGRDVPVDLRRRVADGEVALRWVRRADGPGVMVGLPLPETGAELYEVVPTIELDGTLRALRIALLLSAALTATAGALLGNWAARRVVAPLDDVASAAARIASGALDTRLPETDDPDLTTIVGSFNSMVQAVNDRIERDARFAADVSHELRSPLTALVTSVDVMNRRRAELSGRSAQALDLVTTELARFQRAVEDLLDLSRLEAGASVLELVPTDLRDLVAQTLLEAEVAPAVQVSTGSAPVLARTDRRMMRRALRNLFDNAALHGGGLTGVTIARRDGWVEVDVEDRGPGVPAGERDRIFERFARGGSRGARPGAGLGLSLVAETVHAHGGSIWCTDHEPKGARFVIRLPAAPADDSSVARTAVEDAP